MSHSTRSTVPTARALAPRAARPPRSLTPGGLTVLHPREPSAAHCVDDDALALLLGCHDRIRRFSRVAMRLVSEPASATERAEAARAVGRYFAIALPLHVEDEELSLAPRIAPLLVSPDERAALAQMSREHEAIEVLLAVALPAWQTLAASPERWEELAPLLVGPSDELATLLLCHVEQEERLLFPALDRLPAVELAAIAAEIRARRVAHVPGL